MSVKSTCKAWLEDRFGLAGMLKEQLEQTVPVHATSWEFCFGGLTFLMFVIQVASGVLLMLYYKPTSEAAYKSVEHIMTAVDFGWFIRSVHHWCANLFILLMLIHLVRVFLTGSYKKPRELHWVSGVFLLVLGMAFGFTGYLLPWDQIAYWATTVGTEMAASVPPASFGHFLIEFLRGSASVGGDTLTRFFAVHVIVLPLVAAVFMVAHFLMIRRTGISGPL
jgi:quinol-cytochrome oxidoreductase complex cytochrome b subunit